MMTTPCIRYPIKRGATLNRNVKMGLISLNICPKAIGGIMTRHKQQPFRKLKKLDFGRAFLYPTFMV